MGNRKQNTINGLSLLEVLIAMTIFSTITVFAAQALRQALFNKGKIQSQLDEMSRVRDALNVMRKDFELAIHYLDFELDFNSAVKKQAQTLVRQGITASPSGTSSGGPGGAGPGGRPTGETQVTPEQQVRLQQKLAELETRFQMNLMIRQSPATHFKGSEDKVFFVTGNSLFAQNDDSELQSVYMTKVSYEVRACPIKSDQQCLIRFSNLVTDGEIEQVGKGVTLLEGIKEFKLRYLGQRQQDWVSTWDSRQENAAQKFLYPEAVEISITASTGSGNSDKSITMQAVSFLHFPNNPPDPNQGQGPRRGVNQ